jgi:hypothetical protein
MAMKDPAGTAAKWAQRLGAAGQAITDGVAAVREAPGAKAAAQSAVWLANLQAAQVKWERNVSAVTLQQWQNAMTTKGIPRIGQGATAAIPKMTQFMQQWLPYAEQGRQSLPPRGTVEQNYQRALAMMQYNHNFVRKPYTGV